MIELKNLTKIYHTEKEGAIALKNISLKFPEVGFVALTGQSGSGKTTLLQVLSGFQSYEEGNMFIDGIDALSYQKEDWKEYQKSYVGFVFQDYGLIESYTVLSNVVLALEIVGYKNKDAINKAHKFLKIVHLDELSNQKVSALSSGQKQRLSIARAIAKEPKIVLCDEPTANLDPKNSIEIMELLAEISKKTLVIMSTHNYEDAKGFANYFVRLYKGNLVGFECVRTVEEKETVEIISHKPAIFSIFLTYLKSRKIRTIFTSLFLSIMFIALIIFLSIFISNVDDAKTKVLKHDTFNNINNNELLVMKTDNSIFSQNELDKFNRISHVTDTDYYSLASDMNYYYRKDIDYEEEIYISHVGSGPDSVEITETRIKYISDKLYIKSYKNKVAESSLNAGKLPEKYGEVIAGSEYNVGDKITIYFKDEAIFGDRSIKYVFTVSGVLKTKSADLYFSEEFVKQIDYMIKYSKEYVFYIYLYYVDVLGDNRSYSERFIPFYNENLGSNELVISNAYFESVAKKFPKNYTDASYYEKITETKDKAIVPKEYTSDIPSTFIFVGKDIYDLYSRDYASNTIRIYVDEYPYVDDVINDLSKMGYNILSPYRSSSLTYDDELVNRRSISLILSFSLIVVLLLVFFAFYYLILNVKNNEERVMNLLGANVNLFSTLNILDTLLTLILGIIIGLITYIAILSKTIPYLSEMGKYLRLQHYLLILLLIVIVLGLSNLAYRRKLNKLFVKGGK